MKTGIISVIIDIVAVLGPIVADLEGIAKEARSGDPVVQKVEKIMADLDTLVSTVVKAL